jgi:WD40 repeat protein
VNGVEVSSDGRMLASAVGGTVKLWDLTGQKPTLRETLQQGDGVWHVVFSPDSRMLAVPAGATTTIWDVTERQPTQWTKWEGNAEEGGSYAVAFSPDGRTLPSATTRGKLILRDSETGTIRKEWQLPGPIWWVTYAPDGRHLLTVNSNGTGYILRLATADGKPR